MLDPISQALAAVSSRSAYAVPLVFAAGAASSIGPCVAPRFIAAAGLAAGKTRSRAVGLVFAFVAGLTSTYAAFGAVSSLLGRAVQLSTYTYWAVAVALAAGGCVTLWRGEKTCASAHRHEAGRSAGGALLLGASFALVVSPCCTPLIVGILAYTSAAGSAGYGSLLLACFALGHALPIAAAAFGANGVTRCLQRYSVRQAATVVSAALMLGLSAYYAVLA
jgi:thiol:disulfide interchange protein DsbD